MKWSGNSGLGGAENQEERNQMTKMKYEEYVGADRLHLMIQYDEDQ